MRTIAQFALALACAALAPAPAGWAATTGKTTKQDGKMITVHAILITASNKKGGVDRKLAAYADNLKSNLPFDTFHYATEGRASLHEGGRGTITFAGDHRLELEDDPEKGIHLKVFWLKGPETIISATLTLNPGVPAVLVRRGGGDEVPVVILVAR